MSPAAAAPQFTEVTVKVKDQDAVPVLEFKVDLKDGHLPLKTVQEQLAHRRMVLQQVEGKAPTLAPDGVYTDQAYVPVDQTITVAAEPAPGRGGAVSELAAQKLPVVTFGQGIILRLGANV